MRRYEGQDETRPTAAELYVASVMACFLTFLIILALLVFPALFNGPLEAFGIVIIGGAWGMMLTAFFAFLIIAPIAMLLGIILVRFLQSTIWLGALLGAVTATLLLSAYVAFGSGSTDVSALPLFATFIAIAAFSGWAVQTYILRWPDLRDESDFV